MPKKPSNSPKGKESKTDAQNPEKRRNFPVLGTIAVGVTLAVAGAITAINKKDDNPVDTPAKTRPDNTPPQATIPSPNPSNPSHPRPQTPERRIIPDQFDTEYVHDTQKIIRAIMRERGGLNRTFVIEKGRMEIMNRLPNGQALPGPEDLIFIYPVFNSVDEGSQQVNTRVAEVHIRRIGGRLVAVSVNGPNGAYNLPVNPGMEDQNHFGVAEEAVEDYFAIH